MFELVIFAFWFYCVAALQKVGHGIKTINIFFQTLFDPSDEDVTYDANPPSFLFLFLS